MNKTLGQIAHDAGGFTRQWQHMGAAQREDWERIAQAVIEAQQVAVPDGWVMVPTETLLDIKNRVNTLATLSLKAERYSLGREIKQAIADMLAAAQGAKP